MSQPTSDDEPLPYAPVVVSRFEWPSHETVLPVPGTGYHARVGTRLNGDAGIFPMAAPGERELARFVIAYCRAVFPAGDDGRPLPPSQPGPLRQICVGGGEMVVTESRLCVWLIKANGSLGKVDDEQGTAIAMDVPFRSLGSLAMIREKKLWRGVKEKQIRCYTNRPAGAIDIEPIALCPPDGNKPVRIPLAQAFGQLVTAACDSALSVTLMEADERKRLQSVRDGERTYDELDIIAEIAR